jgi:uncharacterized membrane protein
MHDHVTRVCRGAARRPAANAPCPIRTDRAATSATRCLDGGRTGDAAEAGGRRRGTQPTAPFTGARRTIGCINVDIETNIVISRPANVVSSYAGDPSNAPEWYVNIDSVDWKTPAPLELGSQVEFVAHFLGRTLRYTYEFVELVPGERLVMRTQQGPFPMETTYTWTAAAAGSTRMTLRNRGEPAGFSKLMAPLMKPAMRRANRKDLARLKELLESQPG